MSFLSFVKIHLFYFLFIVSLSAHAIDPADLLPVDEAFKVSAKIVNHKINLSFQSAKGYYLYQHRFSVISQTKDLTLDKFEFPTGEAKSDPLFGDVIIYHDNVVLSIPFKNPSLKTTLLLEINYQGCADVGVCYPPEKKQITLKISENTAKVNAFTQLLTGLTRNLLDDELLAAEEAFQLKVTVKDDKTLALHWTIAEGYYLYREKVQLKLVQQTAVELETYTIPHGLSKKDVAFGEVEIFYQQLQFDVGLLRTKIAAEEIILEVKFQGCAERGVCYSPMTQQVPLMLPIATQISAPQKTPITLSEQNQIAQSFGQESFALTLLSFLGFGLLLAFTPCTFPMIPILSGIIVGQGKNLSTRKAFLLSLAYVVASALTYTVFGVLAALFGSNLQVLFQQTWVVALFSGLFILLSLSMFGFYRLELPKSLQAKLHKSSDDHRDGSYLGAGIMGALSSLVVGPCVAAPLAGALIYIGQSGDVVLGGSALFVMGLGMGVPLLIVGASAGKLLPKAGKWLNSIQIVFGVIMLATALWMLDRILPPMITMLLASMLLIISAMYLHVLEPLKPEANGWCKFQKGIGVVVLIYGILILIGMSMGNKNPLKPLHNRQNHTLTAANNELNFKAITSLNEFKIELKTASAQGKKVMLDFYADWCIACKEMEAYTFTDPEVQNALKDFVLLRADVTKNSTDDKALLKNFNLVGPPAVLFFGLTQQEYLNQRVIGYQKSPQFIASINRLEK
ncbi:MAG: protein-disulfide reductase DsbD [Methylococcales bacterium]|nr:protein-disulfide reductase DsbD [Methylococcales bacterium]